AEVVEGRVMEFETLWDTVVERGLFAAGASQFRRYWGFLLVERLLPFLSESTVPAMMSPNIVRALSDNISLAQKSALAKVSMRAAERLVEICESNSKVGLAVLTHLLNQKSTIQAAGGKQTSLRTMMASRIVAKLDGEAIVGYVSYLQEIFLQPSCAHGRDGVADPVAAINVSDKSVERQRAWAVDQMVRVARFDQVSVSEDVARNVVAFVVAQAAFQASEDQKVAPPLSGTTRDYCAAAVIGVVGDVSRGQGEAWATQAVAAALDGAAKRRAVVILPGFKESKPVLTDALRTLRMLEARAKAWAGTPSAARARALAQLVGNVAVLAAFSSNPQARAEYAEAVPELTECCDKMVAQLDAPQATPRKRTTRSSAASDEPRPVEVLTDVLIGFLTRDSHALRKLCEHVFAPFADLATPAALDAIIGVLQAKEGVAGEEGGGIDAQMEVDDDDEDMEEDDEEDDELAGGDVDEELRRKIQEALGSSSAPTAEDMDGVEVEEEEEVFDDEQMTVFDDKLAEIF
ncbi:DNA-directed DNA polymerase, partial [Coemansia sp. RSA 1836]